MYPFLSQPPQKHLPPPLSPSPSRRRSNSTSVAHPYSNISAWASKVQPGSPAPCSPPHRRPSTSSRRRASHSRVPSASFMAPQRTPSSATGEYPADLTSVGYTSLFVHFDKTPTTPSPFKTRIGNGVATPLTSDVFGSIPIPAVPPLPQSTTTKPTKRIGLQRFRSLSILRPKKSKHVAQPALASSPAKSPKFAKKVESAAIAQRKRAKYVGKKASSAKPPPSLANELALMQFIEGGTVDDNVKRLMDARAKAVGAAKGGEKGVAVETVYRDGKGGIWYDADEEMEYAHLLGAEEDEGEWEEQNENIEDKLEDDFVVVIGPIVKAASPNTNAYCPLDLFTNVRRSPTSTRTSSGTANSSPRMFTHAKPALLSLPCRPRRNLRRPSLSKAYAHLGNTPMYLIDIDAFAPRSPNPKSPRPRGPSVTFAVGPTPSNISKKHRPRPAPLQLSSSQSAHARANAKVALVALNGKSIKASSSPSKAPLMTTINSPSGPGHNVTGLSPSSLDRARREFVEDSFKPTMKVVGSPRLGVMRGLLVKSAPKA